MAKPGKPRRIKFWKYYEEWYQTYKRGSITPISYAKYQLAGKHLKELAPDLVLSELTRFDIQKLMNDYGLTHEKATVRDFYHHISSSIQDAVYEGWIQRDPCYKIQINSTVTHKKGHKWLEADEVRKLEKQIAKDTTGFGDFIDLYLRTGMRFAEGLGITPKDVDFDKRTIYVNKTMNYKNTVEGLEYGEFMPTKNKYSVRIIPVDPQALLDLKKHLPGVKDNESIMQHWFDQLKRGEGRLIGQHAQVYNSTFNKELERMCCRAGINIISWHGLRHTHASLLVANRVSIQSVAKRLGHANTETTQRVYIHLLDELRLEDDQKIVNIMSAI